MKRILFAAALAFFFTACALRSAVSLYNEGNDFYREGRFAEAGERYKEALEKDPAVLRKPESVTRKRLKKILGPDWRRGFISTRAMRR